MLVGFSHGLHAGETPHELGAGYMMLESSNSSKNRYAGIYLGQRLTPFPKLNKNNVKIDAHFSGALLGGMTKDRLFYSIFDAQLNGTVKMVMARNLWMDLTGTFTAYHREDLVNQFLFFQVGRFEAQGTSIQVKLSHIMQGQSAENLQKYWFVSAATGNLQMKDMFDRSPKGNIDVLVLDIGIGKIRENISRERCLRLERKNIKFKGESPAKQMTLFFIIPI